VPLRGATAAPKELTLDVRDGSIVTAVGTSATRISLERPVLDVVESEIDGRGVLWLLADLDDGTMRLVAIDPLVPAIATVRTVDASVFGDVTRRLVASPDGGVVVMSATTSDLVYTRYGR
jgi:hypothetical protein